MRKSNKKFEKMIVIFFVWLYNFKLKTILKKNT